MNIRRDKNCGKNYIRIPSFTVKTEKIQRYYKYIKNIILCV